MVKIVGPIVDTPQVVWKGKVYKKMIFGYNKFGWVDFDWARLAKSNWYIRYFGFSLLCVGLPMQIYFHRLVNSPENKAYWAAKRKADAEKEHKQEWDV